MVSNLIRFKQDPQYPKKNRGAGFYYHRGALIQPNGRRIHTWSKYSQSMDAVIKKSRTKVSNIKASERKQPHKADYKTNKVRRTHRIGSRGPLGHY